MMTKTKPHALFFLLVLLTAAGSVAGCATTTTVEKRPHTIAVWDLDNLNPTELNEFNLGELLAAKAMEVFGETEQWVLVEREELILALEEQNLGSTAAVSEETRLKIGQLLGANFMIFGSYMKFMQTLQLTLRIVDVQSGRIIKASQKTTPFTNVGDALTIAKQMAAELLK